MQHFQVVDGHLQNLCLLQLGRPLGGKGEWETFQAGPGMPEPFLEQLGEGKPGAGLGTTDLLLEGAGHQPPQLRQAVVDAVAAALLDDLRGRAG